MAAIYDATTGETITEGLQGCSRCDEALIAAREWAEDWGEAVHLVDDDGEWIVYQDGHCDQIAATD
jgi:hypothetical protein